MCSYIWPHQLQILKNQTRELLKSLDDDILHTIRLQLFSLNKKDQKLNSHLPFYDETNISAVLYHNTIFKLFLLDAISLINLIEKLLRKGNKYDDYFYMI